MKKTEVTRSIGGSIRTMLRESKGNRETVTRQLLLDLKHAKKDTLLVWLNYTIPETVRHEASRQNIAEYRKVALQENAVPERIQVRVPISENGKIVRYRSTSLRNDCTREDLLTLADLLDKHAAEVHARANAMRKLVEALDEAGVTTTKELSDKTFNAAFDTVDADTVVQEIDAEYGTEVEIEDDEEKAA